MVKRLESREDHLALGPQVAKYQEFLMDHFKNPRNVGEISDPDGTATVGNAQCGDIMQMSIKVNDNRITEVKFKTFGCGAAIATSSILTERVKGTTLDEALKISQRTLGEILCHLSVEKVSCFVLASDALRLAIEEYCCRNFGIQEKSCFEKRGMKREEDKSL